MILSFSVKFNQNIHLLIKLSHVKTKDRVQFVLQPSECDERAPMIVDGAAAAVFVGAREPVLLQVQQNLH